MGANVSCFAPADEDYEFSKSRFQPNPSHGISHDANITGRNTNYSLQVEDAPMDDANPLGSVADDVHSHAHGDTAGVVVVKSSAVSNARSAAGAKVQRVSMPQFRAEQLGYSMNPNNACARYTMFVRNVNNSFSDVDRILSQRLLLGLQRRYGCRMQQQDEVALFRGNEVRLATIDGPSRSHICKFRSALPASLTRFLITGVNHSADVDDVLDTN